MGPLVRVLVYHGTARLSLPAPSSSNVCSERHMLTNSLFSMTCKTIPCGFGSASGNGPVPSTVATLLNHRYDRYVACLF